MGLFGWVLWICMTDCAVVSETKIVPSLTGAQCLQFLDFYQWQQKSVLEDQLRVKSSLDFYRRPIPNEVHCISPEGKRYSTGRWILDEETKTVKLREQEDEVATLKQLLSPIGGKVSR